MSGALTPAGGGAVASGDAAATYGLTVTGLRDAASQLALVAERARLTYQYVEGCAEGVDLLADQMDGLTVDTDTVSEHREAAAAMRSVLAAADRMAAGLEDLSSGFAGTASTHQKEYGTVADTASSMTVPMANAGFYANR